MNRSERSELKNGVGESEERERHPNAFETQDAAQAVAQRQADRIEKENDEVAGAKSEQRIDARNAGESHRPNESNPNAR
jgi:ssDNA-binding replication factor A large subunit